MKRDSKPVTEKNARRASSRPASFPRRVWLWLVPLVVVGLGIAGWWYWSQRAGSVTPPVDLTRPMGGVGACGAIPRFARAVGFSGNVVFSTSERRTKGMLMFDPAAPPDQKTGSTHYYQHPSWSAAGFLGPVVPDENGNLYIAPVPHISVLDNPASEQMRIYRVDTNSGVMNILTTLPAAASSSTENPYGLLGLTYDCETHTLYASSVSGSTRQNEIGRLYHIDPNSRRVLSEFDNVDALGVGVFKGSTGKRLYFGATRLPEVRSIALDAQGNFVGAPRVDTSLGAVARDANDKARRITFSAQNEMLITGVQFDYNLIAPSVHVNTFYTYAYDPSTDTWTFKSLTPG